VFVILDSTVVSYLIVCYRMVFLILDLTWLLGYLGLWCVISPFCLFAVFAIVVLAIVLLVLILEWAGAWVEVKTSFWFCLIFAIFVAIVLLDCPWSEAWVWAKTSSGPGFALLDFCLILLDLRRGFRRKPRSDWAWFCVIFAIFLLSCGLILHGLMRRIRRKPCLDLGWLCLICAI